MSSPTRHIAALGLVALPLVWGCAGEDAEQRANFPRAPGSDAWQEAPQGAIPEGMPTQETAMEGVADEPMPTYPDLGDNPPGGDYADTDPSALTDFHSTLDSHGQWLEDPNYGTMWQPSEGEVGGDFAPYVSGGHWGYDDSDDYVWVSDYGWGWAPFHYGRWAYGGSGWGWIPGRSYAPSWVTWRTGATGYGYVGWAPLPPTYYWGPGGVARGLGGVPSAPYAFVATNHLFAPTGLSGRVISAPGALRTIAGQTHPYAPPAGGRVPANPTVAGPTPQSLNIANNQVNHVPANNPQLARAQQFSRPSTATAMGAHGPAVGGHLGPIGTSRGAPGASVASGSRPQQMPYRASMPSYGGSSHSYYNNRTSTQLGSSYGHGGSMRSYSAPSGTHLGSAHVGAAAQPSYVEGEGNGGSHPTTSTSTSSAHFGGHYGGSGGHGGGGHR
jgi:hypothetical protein